MSKTYIETLIIPIEKYKKTLKYKGYLKDIKGFMCLDKMIY